MIFRRTRLRLFLPLAVGAVVAVGAVLALEFVPERAALRRSHEPTLRAPAVGDSRATTLADAPPALRSAWIAARQADGASDARYHARAEQTTLLIDNAAGGLEGRFDRRGVALRGAGLDGRLDARELRCGALAAAIGPAAPRVDRAPNRITLDRQVGAGFRVSEWYTNGPLGLEQGFDIARDRAGEPAHCDGDLLLALDTPGFVPALAEGAVRLASADGAHAFTYAELAATDATGRNLPAHFGVTAGGVTLAVDVRGAMWPIAIDPLVYLEDQRIGPAVAGEGAADDQFGASVALSVDAALVGAPHDTVGPNAAQGSVYYFRRIGGAWFEQTRLVAADGAAGDHFGSSVALDGSTALIGATDATVGGNPAQGATYVLTRSGFLWSQQQKLTQLDGAAGDHFGSSVALDGSSALIGARADDVAGNLDQGSATVFLRTGTIWTPQQRLDFGAASDDFGCSVALDGDSAFVGARLANVGANADQGAAYLFVRSGGSWTLQQRLFSVDGAPRDFFGHSVALDGSSAVVGATGADQGGVTDVGAAFVFVRTGTTWAAQQRLFVATLEAGDEFGTSVALSGDLALIGVGKADAGATDSGSAYLFERRADYWFKQEYAGSVFAGAFFPGALADRDSFGAAVALQGRTLLVGAPRDDIGVNPDQGSACVFDYQPLTASYFQQAQFSRGLGTNAIRFGHSVALSANTALVGTVADDVGAEEDQGSATVFVRTGTTWSRQARLTADDGAAYDNFGVSIALDGDTALIGADGANDGRGAAYVFLRSGTTWFQQARLIASGGALFDGLGGAVALSGETALVGAPGDTIGLATNCGSAFVFVRSGTSWSAQAQLFDTGGAANDHFATSVALVGENALVGAAGDDVGSRADQGSAFVFVRGGTSWSLEAQLVSSTGASGDGLGASVAFSGDSALVGAPAADIGTAVDQGSATLFVRSAASWSEQAQLTTSSGAPGDGFGASVALSGDLALIGAANDTVGANLAQGSATVFLRTGTTWSEDVRLTAGDGSTGDQFGAAVALSGRDTLVGAPTAIGPFPYGNALEGAGFVGHVTYANGASCVDAAECTSGFCADGVCCNTACGGSAAGDCMACSSTQTAGANGVCAPLSVAVAPTVLCRAAAGDCDQSESCVSTGTACPADARVAAATTCRPAADLCDLADACTGTNNACPFDAKVAERTVCRAATDLCDAAETCTGTTDACPIDALAGATRICRAPVGACDLAESCTGATNACPADAKVAAATVCRPTVGLCDAAESCSGVDNTCPADSKAPPTTSCRAAAAPCDAVEFCSGTADACPVDAKAPPATVCRAPTGPCDVVETCTGLRDACPADAVASPTTICRAAIGACDLAEWCSGTNDVCPADAMVPAATECRPQAGACDLAESCSGADSTCPADGKAAVTTLCRAPADLCDAAEVCSGDDDVCPTDAKATPTTICRVAVGPCDLADACSGTADACPVDAKADGTIVCRASVDLCDAAESCSGSDDSCPTDAKFDATIVCRASAGLCDLAESCAGATDACPPDLLASAGAPCRAASCAGGTGVPAVTCEGSSIDCPLAASLSCELFVCGADACLGACVTDGECVATAYCVDGACTGRLDDGTSCPADRHCLSGHCVDGVCCDSACPLQCEACAEPGTEGSCTPIVGAPRGARTACADDDSGCGGACGGTDAAGCAFPDTDTACRTASCLDALATVAAGCDGAGACPAETTVACTPFSCAADGLACSGDCVTHADCASEHFCQAGACVLTLATGAPCADDGACASGFCVDGACCDSACEGQCEACGEAGREGDCTKVLGEPRGGRAACASDGSACAGTCNRTTADACAYPDSATTCSERRCDSAMLIDLGVCDGVGACTDPPAFLCPNGCEAGACLPCTTDDECATGEVCAAGVCVTAPPSTPTGCDCRIARADEPSRSARGLLVLLILLGLGSRLGSRHRAPPRRPYVP